jgi:uncharacterized protein YraI
MVGLTLAASAAAVPSLAWAGELFAHGELSLRRGPGPRFAVVTTVGAGQRITVLWCNASANWCLVDDGLMQGWTPIDSLRRDSGSDSGSMANGGVSAAGVGSSVPAMTQATAAANAGGLGLSVNGGDISVSAGSGGVSVKLP